MNFTSGGTEQETLDLEEQKLIRQKEWEEARQRESKMPEHKKPENYDPRSLYERLQEQKDKKQEEFDEKMKFKNQIVYLDDDDVSFLEEKAREEEEKEAAKWEEEMEAVKAFRQQVLQKEENKAEKFNTDAKGPLAEAAPARKKESLSSLVKPKKPAVAGLVVPGAAKKRPSEAEQPAGDSAKKTRPDTSMSDSTSAAYDDEDLSDRAPSLGTSILAAYGSDSEQDDESA